jgi:hypothetical protein
MRFLHKFFVLLLLMVAPLAARADDFGIQGFQGFQGGDPFSGSDAVISLQFDLLANTTYKFTFDAVNLGGGDPAILEAVINGADEGGLILPSTHDFAQFGVLFTTGANPGITKIDVIQENPDSSDKFALGTTALLSHGSDSHQRRHAVMPARRYATPD